MRKLTVDEKLDNLELVDKNQLLICLIIGITIGVIATNIFSMLSR